MSEGKVRAAGGDHVRRGSVAQAENSLLAGFYEGRFTLRSAAPAIRWIEVMADYVKVGEVGEFKKARGRVVELEGVKVAIFWTGDRFIALKDACPHMGASLADGKLEGNRVVCPWHGWEYDVETGQSGRRSWACVPVYEVKVEGTDVLLRRPAPPKPAEFETEVEDEEWMSWDPNRFFKAENPSD